MLYLIALRALRLGASGARFESKQRIAATRLTTYISVQNPYRMEVIMSERIRYAQGRSSLGNFVAAVSDRGLVAFEFADDNGAAMETLRAAFPAASLEEDAEGLGRLVETLEALVDHPETDPGIALDPRGSDYQRKVWALLREIPAGETTSYGALAALLGTRDAREVTEAIASNAIAILIPCHRVVKKDGSLSGYRWGFKRKRALIERERRAASPQGL
jgi:AraC family transcriptional regulator, regulatory protein of adaptative response / methylated-DNA-[protein]-cysteine methyltransferase